jgi:hypothetical protein
LDELVLYPRLNADVISEKLVSKGWNVNSLEFVADSHFVRRTWMVPNNYNDLKSYVLFYDFTNDTSENHLIYQFSDKKILSGYQTQLDKAGFTHLKQKSKGKKNRKEKIDPGVYKEKTEVYYSEKHITVIELREVFIYGMNSYLVYTYKANSGIGKNTVQETGNKVPKIQD